MWQSGLKQVPVEAVWVMSYYRNLYIIRYDGIKDDLIWVVVKGVSVFGFSGTTQITLGMDGKFW